MQVCSCANPGCMVNGCQIARGLGGAECGKNTWTSPLYAFQPAPLTAEGVRQIIREELETIMAKKTKPKKC